MLSHTEYTALQSFSQRLLEATRGVRLLDHLKWHPDVSRAIVASKYKHFPHTRDLQYFLPLNKKECHDRLVKLQELEADSCAALKADHPLVAIFLSTLQSYGEATQLIQSRGTPEFYTWSKKIFGSATDLLHAGHGRSSLIDFCNFLEQELLQTPDSAMRQGHALHDKSYSAIDSVQILQKRLHHYFQDHKVTVKVADHLMADAAAGGDVIKLRDHRNFSETELKFLEVHEGWVHIGTTRNGQLQKNLTWLAKGPPRTLSTQEGLAIFMEIFMRRASKKRFMKLIHRVQAIAYAEKGANLKDLVHFYEQKGYALAESFQHARRIFRGALLEGGSPFTKDLVYMRGLLEIFHEIDHYALSSQEHLLPYWFAGKLAIADVPVLYQAVSSGYLAYPKFVPADFLQAFEVIRTTPMYGHYAQWIQMSHNSLKVFAK